MSNRNPIDRLSSFLGDQISYVFLVTVVITAYEVVMRYVFNSATIWVTQVAIFLSAVGFIFGGAYALQQGRHIEITSIYDAVSPRVRAVFDLIRDTIAVIYLGFLLYACTRLALQALSRMETSGQAWDVPIPTFQKTALALGVALMLAQALRHLIDRLRSDRATIGEPS